jgi:two-component system response regulator PilR (NtrC family)
MKSGSRILVVDDEASVTDAFEIILNDLGQEVKTAGTVADALKLLGEGALDLVFTDLRLPDGTGIDLLDRIKESTRRRKSY